MSPMSVSCAHLRAARLELGRLSRPPETDSAVNKLSSSGAPVVAPVAWLMVRDSWNWEAPTSTFACCSSVAISPQSARVIGPFCCPGCQGVESINGLCKGVLLDRAHC